MENSQDFWHELLEEFTEIAKTDNNPVGFSLGYEKLENAYSRSWWEFLLSSGINEWGRKES